MKWGKFIHTMTGLAEQLGVQNVLSLVVSAFIDKALHHNSLNSPSLANNLGLLEDGREASSLGIHAVKPIPDGMQLHGYASPRPAC